MKKILFFMAGFLLLGKLAGAQLPAGSKPVDSKFFIVPANGQVWQSPGAPFSPFRSAAYSDVKRYADSLSASKANLNGGNTLNGIQQVNQLTYYPYGASINFGNQAGGASLQLRLGAGASGNITNTLRPRSGIVSLLSDIDSAGNNYLHKTGDITEGINGIKTFNGKPTFENGISLSADNGSNVAGVYYHYYQPFINVENGQYYMILGGPDTPTIFNIGVQSTATPVHPNDLVRLTDLSGYAPISGSAAYMPYTGGVFTGDVFLPNTTPTNANQAVPKFYIDNLMTGISWKNAVRVKTTANITLSGTQTIDGVAVVAGNRVLVSNQTDATQNGIYVVAVGAWTRATDADSGDELSAATVAVMSGTANKNTQWTNIDTYVPVIGTDNIDFGQISGAGTYTNSNGVDLTANVFSLNSGYTRGLFGSTSPLTYNATTGAFGIQSASGSQSGALSSTDWSTFNSKQSATDFSPQSILFRGASAISDDNANFKWDYTNKTLRLSGATSANPSIITDGYGAGNFGNIVFRSARGTSTSPSATLSGDLLGVVSVNGYGSTGFPSNSYPLFATAASENWTDTNNGNQIVFGTAANGSNTWRERLRISNNGNIGIGTAGNGIAILDIAQSSTGDGVISTTAGGTTVTGTNTQFTNTFRKDQTITGNGETHTITAIASNTSMTTDAWTNTNTNVAYTLSGGTVIQAFGNKNVYVASRLGIGTSTPTARVEIAAGTTTLQPIKLTSGSLLTTPVAGSIEFLNDRYYATQTTGTTRQQLAYVADVPTVGNPTATVGTAAVNGTATTFMRSDAAPAFNTAISPTLTGTWTWGNNQDFSTDNTYTIGNTTRGASVYYGRSFLSNSAAMFGTVNANSAIFLIGNTEKARFATDGSLLVNTSSSDGINKLLINGSAKATQFRLSALNTAPTSSTDTGTTGEIRYTSGFLYLCTATNTWVRSAFSTF